MSSLLDTPLRHEETVALNAGRRILMSNCIICGLNFDEYKFGGWAAWEARSSNLEVGTDLSIFLHENKVNLCRDGRWQDLPDEYWLLASLSIKCRHIYRISSYLTGKHSASITATKGLTFLRKIIAVLNRTKHIDALCVQNAYLHNVKTDGTYIYHFAIKN
jgi:hypothetical protein